MEILTYALLGSVALIAVLRTAFVASLRRKDVYTSLVKGMHRVLNDAESVQLSGNLLSFADSALTEKNLLLDNQLIAISAWRQSDAEERERIKTNMAANRSRISELEQEIRAGKSALQ
jgi:hypothetical protein